MPIVAGIGGNTGNQILMVWAMALQIDRQLFTFLILREMGVALINGLVWGGIMRGPSPGGCIDDPQLGGVMTLAMMLNLLMAAMMGVMIPMVMVKLGRDPAVGSSVMITAITDTGGFFIFLGLATLFNVACAFYPQAAGDDRHRDNPPPVRRSPDCWFPPSRRR